MSNSEKIHNKLLLSWLEDVRSILTLAGPLIIAQCAQSGILFIDLLLLGRIGPQAIAGGALAISAFYLCYIFSFGIVSGAGNLVAIAHGARRHHDVISAVRCGLILACLLSMVMGGVLWNIYPLMLMIGQDPITAQSAQQFLHILLWGMPFGLIFLVLRGFTAGIGKPGPIPLIMFSSFLLSGLLGWWLSTRFGMQGIAIASLVTYCYMGFGLIFIVHTHRHYRHYAIFSQFTGDDLTTLPSIMKIGLPAAGTLGLENSLFNGCTWLMGGLGVTALAAHQSLMQLVITSFTVPLGLMYAVTFRVGQAAGAENWYKVKSLCLTGNIIVACWSMFAIMLLLCFPDPLLSLFLSSDTEQGREAKRLAMLLVLLAALLCLLDGWQTLISGLLRALKDGMSTVLICTFSYLFVGLPLAWWLSRHDLGASGIWWGLCIGLTTGCIFMQYRLQRILSRCPA